jgi:PAS domain S-box-containing protein
VNSSALPSIDFSMLSAWFEIAPDAMIAVDQEGAVVLVNAQAAQMFDYGQDALHGLPLERLLPESLRSAHSKHRHDYMMHPRVRPMGIGYQLMGARRDGSSFPVEIGLSPIQTEKGIIAIASVRDISETWRVRRALAHARRDNLLAQIGRLTVEAPGYEQAIGRIPELVALALEIPAVAILSMDLHRSELQMRASTGLSGPTAATMESIFGSLDFIRASFGGKSREIVTFDSLGTGALASVRQDLASAGFRDIAIVPLSSQDETLGLLIALASTAGDFDRDKIGFLQSVATLLAAAAQRGRSEEQLAHVQRLDAIGQLTGGIAHDFNNLLTVISGNLQLLEGELSDRPNEQEIIESALRAVDRGSNLTRKLLAFARRQPLQPRAIAIKPLLEELGLMLRRTLGEMVSVKIDCQPRISDVYADGNELDTVLVNLALNARDAMPRGGELVILARDVTLDNPENDWKLAPGDYVAFTVSDTGTGMSPDVLAHALEPFFTTKGAGKGSGLGLSMAYGFVTQSGGAMSIKSRLGYGTQAELLLPVANAGAGLTEDLPTLRSAAAASHATVLVVEDETDVRTVAARFLGVAGYDVITAAGAPEAMDVLAARADVDLLFSDVVLGSGMNGVELANEARRAQPGLAVLLTSGHEFQVGGEHPGHISTEAFELLRKPYRREQLLSMIRRILDRT